VNVNYFALRCEKRGNSGSSSHIATNWCVIPIFYSRRAGARYSALIAVVSFESCRFGKRSDSRAGSPVDLRCWCARRSRQIITGTSGSDADSERLWLPCTQRSLRYFPLRTDGIIIGTSKKYEGYLFPIDLVTNVVTFYFHDSGGAPWHNHAACPENHIAS